MKAIQTDDDLIVYITGTTVYTKKGPVTDLLPFGCDDFLVLQLLQPSAGGHGVRDYDVINVILRCIHRSPLSW